MVASLLDTILLVDLLRQHSPALIWFKSQPRLGIAYPVVLEVLGVSRDKKAQEQAKALITNFEIIDLAQADQDWSAVVACLSAQPRRRHSGLFDGRP